MVESIVDRREIVSEWMKTEKIRKRKIEKGEGKFNDSFCKVMNPWKQIKERELRGNYSDEEDETKRERICRKKKERERERHYIRQRERHDDNDEKMKINSALNDDRKVSI